MTTAISIAFICLYAVLDGLADAFIFREQRLDKGANGQYDRMQYAKGVVGIAADLNTNWHRAQAAQQAMVIGVTAYLSGTWTLILLGAALFWLIHDGIVNRIGLDRPFFFVGTTAWIDRTFRRLFSRPELAMAMAKAAALISGIGLFIVEKI